MQLAAPVVLTLQQHALEAVVSGRRKQTAAQEQICDGVFRKPQERQNLQSELML
jgi:alpha-D-ribose 1-methylphosphonate 5-triphosphate synthase subunit PhnG